MPSQLALLLAKSQTEKEPLTFKNRNVTRPTELPNAITFCRTATTPGRRSSGIQRTSLSLYNTHCPLSSSEYECSPCSSFEESCFEDKVLTCRLPTTRNELSIEKDS